MTGKPAGTTNEKTREKGPKGTMPTKPDPNAGKVKEKTANTLPLKEWEQAKWGTNGVPKKKRSCYRVTRTKG